MLFVLVIDYVGCFLFLLTLLLWGLPLGSSERLRLFLDGGLS